MFLFGRYPIPKAIIWSVVGGFLLLPVKVGWNLPLVPTLDKVSITNISILIVLVAVKRVRVRLFGDDLLVTFIITAGILGPILTAVFNSDGLVYGAVFLRNLSLQDGVATALIYLIGILAFVIGRNVLDSEASHQLMLATFALGGLLYTLPVILELRLSPQLHNWVYGFFPHTFGQMKRDGGFRPVVFLGHGLSVSFFLALTVAATASLWRQRIGQFTHRGSLLIGFLLGVLILAKSVASILYGFFFVLVIGFVSKKTQLRIAVVLVLFTFTYPIGRSIFPVDNLLITTAIFNEERTASLAYRLRTEEYTLAKSNLRPLFGWGKWGRNFVYNENGRRLIQDGVWIIVLSSGGWIGYISVFGLLGVSVLKLYRLAGERGFESINLSTTALCVIAGVNMIELIPNSFLPPLTWLISGSILGYVERERRQIEDK